MARCRECFGQDVKISATPSRSSFVFQCVNPRCRHTYVKTLGLAGDLIPVFGAIQKRRQASRGARDSEEVRWRGEDSE
jgi:hypothetical protein